MNLRFTLGSIGGTLLGAAGWLANNSSVVSAIVPQKFGVPLMGVASLVLLFSHSIKPNDTTLAAVPAPDKSTAGPITFQKTGVLASPKP